MPDLSLLKEVLIQCTMCQSLSHGGHRVHSTVLAVPTQHVMSSGTVAQSARFTSAFHTAWSQVVDLLRFVLVPVQDVLTITKTNQATKPRLEKE